MTERVAFFPAPYCTAISSTLFAEQSCNLGWKRTNACPMLRRLPATASACTGCTGSTWDTRADHVVCGCVRDQPWKGSCAVIERPAWRVKPAHAHADSDLTGPYAAVQGVSRSS